MQPIPQHISVPLRQHLHTKQAAALDHGVGGGPAAEEGDAQVDLREGDLRWALVDCAEAERRQLSPQGERMDEVVLLLSQQFGPFIMRQVCVIRTRAAPVTSRIYVIADGGLGMGARMMVQTHKSTLCFVKCTFSVAGGVACRFLQHKLCYV